MALSKEEKEKAANSPDRHTGFNNDKVSERDANPANANLANKNLPETNNEPVKSGRDLPDTTNDSAPKARR